MAGIERVVKLVVLGDICTGKTSIMRRYCSSTFSQDTRPTLAFDVGYKLLGSTKVDLWDTAGQEAYRSLARQVYRGMHGAILVYDVGSVKTFESLKTYWLQEVRNAEKDALVLLLGNKADIDPHRVQPQDVRVFAETYSMDGSLVSAKTGDGVVSAIDSFVAKIVERHPMVVYHDVVTSSASSDRSSCCY